MRWLESAGARVAPVLYNQSDDSLRHVFDRISGLLLPGGHCGSHGTAYGNATWRLLSMAKAANDAGTHFPIWGTCQGHEQLAQFATGAPEPSVLRRTIGTEGMIVPLNVTRAGAATSRLLGSAPASVRATLQQAPVTVHLHSFSALASRIERTNSSTHAFFKVVATNRDARGVEFVSLMEGRHYPFYGSQFHPEKNAFEWNQSWEANNTAADVGATGGVHSADGVAAAAFLARFFVDSARLSPHRWDEDEPAAHLIYDFVPTRTVTTTSQRWEQCYVF